MMTRPLLMALAWLTISISSSAQDARPEAAAEVKPEPDQTFSGQVIDSLGRPVPGVRISVQFDHKTSEEDSQLVLRTDVDGKYSGILPNKDKILWVEFDREGYGGLAAHGRPRGETVLYREIDWDEVWTLPDREGDELDNGIRELLASRDWNLGHDEKLLSFLFRHQREFHPALRRLILDTHVGIDVRDWIDLLDDPQDADILVNKKRPYLPKKEIKEIDLIDALKATVRQRNFFTSSPEPMISIDFLSLTEELDRAMIQCGINRGPLSGITWQFVFHKVGTQWVLRSAKEAGRS